MYKSHPTLGQNLEEKSAIYTQVNTVDKVSYRRHLPDTGHSMMIVLFSTTLRKYTTFDSSMDGGTEKDKKTKNANSKN